MVSWGFGFLRNFIIEVMNVIIAGQALARYAVVAQGDAVAEAYQPVDGSQPHARVRAIAVVGGDRTPCEPAMPAALVEVQFRFALHGVGYLTVAASAIAVARIIRFYSVVDRGSNRRLCLRTMGYLVPCYSEHRRGSSVLYRGSHTTHQ